MAELTDEQIEFLEHHKIPLDVVYDASWLEPSEYREAMGDEYWFAYGVDPCSSGHTLKTKSGRCIQCSPTTITYVKKYYEPGYVYLAWSESLKLCKIGVASDLDKRIRGLNSVGYGGAKDWVRKRACEHLGPAIFEAEMHELLKHHAVARTYKNNYTKVTSRELFDCDPKYVARLMGHIFYSWPLNEGDAPMTIFNDPQRTRLLPTTVALHVVHKAFEIVDDEECSLPRRKQIKIRSLAETVLSAVSHGIRYKLAKVPDACIDAYRELDAILDELDDAK